MPESFMTPPWPVRRGRTTAAWTLTALLAAVAAPAGAAAAAEPDDVLLEVRATLDVVVVEPVDEADEAEQLRLLEVDGLLYELPSTAPATDAVSGDEVVVTLEADAGMDAAAALTAAAEPAAPGDAEVLALEPVDEDADGLLEAATLGTHKLTVLPVYWTAPDGATSSSLANVAAATSQFWSEQTGGALALQYEVRGWAQIPAPVTTCNTSDIWAKALTAHGLTDTTSATNHVAVYFPAGSSGCGGWAGMASVGGGRIWINGSQVLDVLAHEFGHNLGLGHANVAVCTSGGAVVPYAAPFDAACDTGEYEDTADVMGFGWPGKATGNLNTAMADHLGLVSAVRLTAPPVGTMTIDLAPLAQVGAQRAIRVAVAGGAVYLDYRPAVGRDTRKTTWAGVQVHFVRPEGGAGAPESYLLDMNPSAGSFVAPAMPAGATWEVPGTGVRLMLTGTGATARLTVGDDWLQRYVVKVYADLFHRTPDPVGLQTWTASLASGTPRGAVANAITASDEYRGGLIAESYATYLGRGPDAPGLQFWLGLMASGWTIQQMESGFLASSEYYAQAGSDDAAWITRLYGHVLGRAPGGSEVAHWLAVLAGGADRRDVAIGFLLSTEHLRTVVDGYYGSLLGRGIDPVGATNWVRLIQQGMRVEEIIAGIVSSEEYASRV